MGANPCGKNSLEGDLLWEESLGGRTLVKLKTMSHFADILLPLAQPAYTYAIPDGMTVVEGQAVAVQFGAKGFYTGIVWRVHDERPNFKRIKAIHHLLFDFPLLTHSQMRFWEWMSTYYMTSLGEVMRAALPTLMKPSGKTEEEFSKDEFRPRTETYVIPNEELWDEERQNEVFEKLMRRAPRQYEALLEILSPDTEGRTSQGAIPRRLLRAELPALHALERKGYIRREEWERSVEKGATHFLLPELSEAQERALETIRESFAGGKTATLLLGVTGSGKTEIYIHLIAEVLRRGGDVLLLVPEIAITAQLIERMERIFGSRVTPYHSKLTNHRRTETYLRLCRGEGGEFVVGARSALFLPMNHLQLIIVDEEHDTGYKQSEPSPRYHARDCSVVLSQIVGGHTLLGSATPSLETWLNAHSGKYGLAELGERYGEGVLPQIVVSDTLRAVKRGERKAHFNKLLLDKIEETLARGEQVMLFQNRRGFSPYVECSDCGWTARCPHCNVTLTYHKADEVLVCHYCGYTTSTPRRCPACKVADIQPMGFGTEKVEQEIAALFPEARVGRLDRDKATSVKAFQEVLTAFAQHEIDILVGTQMITKGFDFEGVELVGILNADNLLHNPDFRAGERAFQMMQQVAGRAGRRSNRGEVVIQTSEPAHPIIRQVVTDDFEGMARQQLSEREAFFYPPYARLTSLTLRHRDPVLLRRAAGELAANLRQRFGRRILGPMPPPVDRIRGEYLVGILLKVEHGASSARAREILWEELGKWQTNPDFKSIKVIPDVDPQ